MNEWIENTGTVPDGVAADSVIEVEYRDGAVVIWRDNCNVHANDCGVWTITGSNFDVMKWRFV